MESKKLSRTVQKRLRKKGIILPSSTPAKSEASLNSVNISTSAKKKKKKCKTKRKGKVEQKPEPVAVVEVKSDVRPTVTPVTSTVPPTGKNTNTTSKHRKRDPKDVVTYINSKHVSNDADEVGDLIHAELVGLRKQSRNIKSASDLTENQAHVIKRQITKLHGAEVEREFKRPKHCEKTLGEATEELARLLKERKAKLATTSNKSGKV
ncbi:uncharacterized protein LOC119078709 [Bradysia coprophila]|uniref:uncharacterized protein LOC119078709 n=1 Tax=Bradysia coprophila TaxID=38358 RepID=UPI00187DC9B1|nr:uncharacterized protein LOC119078709 [Bradysia coprophila]